MRSVGPARLALIALPLAMASSISAQEINRAWTRTYDGGGIESSADIAIGATGDPYVVGTAAVPDSSSTLLVHYSTTGNFIFAKKIGYQQITEPHLAADDSGNAFVQAFHHSGSPQGGFVMKVSPGGSARWIHNLGTNAYPVGVQCVGNQVYAVDNDDWGPWYPEWWILSSDGQTICNRHSFRTFYGWNMKVPPAGDPIIVGSLDSPGGETTIAAMTFNDGCDRTWNMAFGLGCRAWGAVVTFDVDMKIVGNIEIGGSRDVWVGQYDLYSPYEARHFDVMDWAGGDDEVSSGASSPNGSAVTGHAKDTTQDVLVGRLGGGEFWWVYDGPAHGTDEGVDVDFLPNGHIVVLAKLGTPTGGIQQGLLLYDTMGELLDVEIEPSISPVALAISAAGEVYTTGLIAGNIVIEKYTITPATGIPSSPQSPSNVMPLTISPVPSSGSVSIRVDPGSVKGKFAMAVYDVMGRRIRDLAASDQAGRHDFIWDGKNQEGKPVSAGVYFIQLDLGQRRLRGRAVIAR